MSNTRTPKRMSLARRKTTPPNPEKFYRDIFGACYIHAYHALNADVLRVIRADPDMEVIPIKLYMSKVAGKEIYYNPVPRSIKPIIDFIVAAHNRVRKEIADTAKSKFAADVAPTSAAPIPVNADSEFIAQLCAIPPVRNQALANVTDPNNFIRATLSAEAMRGNVDNAVRGMTNLVKAIVEAMLGCAIISGHAPGVKVDIIRICQAAYMSPPLIAFAKAAVIAGAEKPSRTKPAPQKQRAKAASAKSDDDSDSSSGTEESGDEKQSDDESDSSSGTRKRGGEI